MKTLKIMSIIGICISGLTIIGNGEDADAADLYLLAFSITGLIHANRQLNKILVR